MTLRISESFHSIQGEGVSVGVNAYFIRLQGCNLICGGRDGKLVKEGKATWHCDSEAVWKRGKEVTDSGLVDKFIEAGQLGPIITGQTHLIWTGGEPMLDHHRGGILEFLRHVDYIFPSHEIYNEIETNATIEASSYFMGRMQQINASPKLSNSGMPLNRRINQVTLDSIGKHPNGWFKFVVTSPEDVEEIERDYIKGVGINKRKVILMPGVETLAEYSQALRETYEIAKEFGYRAIGRGQVAAWDRTCGV